MRTPALFRQTIYACCILASIAQAHAQEFAASIVSTSFADTPAAPNGIISLTFDKPLQTQDGRIAVIYGKEDVSMNFRMSAPEVLQGDFSMAPLNAGSETLTVYFVSADQKWTELAHATLTIASGKQASTSTFKPHLVIGTKTQVHEKTESNTTSSGRTGAVDLTLQAGMEAAASGDDWKVQSQMAVAGSSFRPETVAYEMKGANASPVDLASYLVQGSETNRFGEASFSLGDVQFGNHPALVNQLGNRGLVVGQKFGSRVDLAFASQAGGMIQGANNLFGMNDAGHRIDSFTLGAELLERASGLRVELSHTDAAVRAMTAPGSGFAPEAAKSRGWGVRTTGKTADETLRGELLYSASDHTPAGDPAYGISAGPTSNASAYVLEVGYDALRNAMWGGTPASLSLGFKREHAGMGYFSLAANQFSADYLMDTASLNTNIGAVNAVLQLNRREDNVDNQRAFLKNRVRGAVLNINTPLAQLANSAAPPPWLPTLGYGFNRSHNFADTGFVPLGQTAADLPDVLVTTHTLNIGWNIAPFTFGYAYSRTLQDTWQLMFAARDMRDIRHAVNLAWMPRPELSINGAIDTTRSSQLDTGMARNSHNGQFTFNWIANPQYTLSGGANMSLNNADSGQQSQRTQQLQCQIARNFAWTSFNSSKAPGQGYIKLLRNVNESNNATLIPAASTTGRTTLMLGLNLTFL